ncbi:protoporphyrinogen oxidase HemJ [Telmatospirillum sp. J64-1]|uniref:protoporphyrinogen oxidase HemJ n=1 Tax=Telmatospirillum sp. J64-1 TaxID=2502183 RepID=UPI00115CA352|nr:protoporphyrinogen oxidase HemJ [Telmatospirillum sp. J64-1]
MTYLWIKALHVISIIAWMAALLYLPRLFVYHCEAKPGSEMSEKLKVMERRLHRAIMNPAMMAAWIFGLTMVFLNPGLLQGQGWLHAKIFFVLILTATHVMMGRWRAAFAEDRNKNSQKFYRFANEVPTVLMILIVIMVIVRPF